VLKGYSSGKPMILIPLKVEVIQYVNIFCFGSTSVFGFVNTNHMGI